MISVVFNAQLDLAAVDSPLRVEVIEIEAGAGADLLADKGDRAGQVCGHTDENLIVGNARYIIGLCSIAGRQDGEQGENDE